MSRFNFLSVCPFKHINNIFEIFNLEGFNDVGDDLVEHPVPLAQHHAHMDILNHKQ